jgi:hypothetical protein
MTNPVCPAELKRLYHQGRIIPFVGAGASMAVRWKRDGLEQRGPSWAELVNQAVSLVGVDDPELLRLRGTDLQILEYLRGRLDTIQPLINWLHTNMQPDDGAIRTSVLHQALAALDKCNLYYTTNYDNFLERSFRLNDRSVARVASEHDLSEPQADVQLVKFHGDFDRPETMVLSESDYERRMRLEGVLDLKLRSDVLGRALLFVGYSFRDANVAYLFRLMTDHFKNLPQSFAGKRAYIIYPNPSDFELQLFHSRQIEVVPIVGRDLSPLIADVLTQMAE